MVVNLKNSIKDVAPMVIEGFPIPIGVSPNPGKAKRLEKIRDLYHPEAPNRFTTVIYIFRNPVFMVLMIFNPHFILVNKEVNLGLDFVCYFFIIGIQNSGYIRIRT